MARQFYPTRTTRNACQGLLLDEPKLVALTTTVFLCYSEDSRTSHQSPGFPGFPPYELEKANPGAQLCAYRGFALVREISIPHFSGVYILAELQHKYSNEERRWSCNFLYYVGESSDVAYRFLSHRASGVPGRPRACWDIPQILNPRMALLYETKHCDAGRRKSAERRHIAAAVQMGLPLCNRQLYKVDGDFQEERDALRQAVTLFDAISTDAWPHKGNRPCEFKVAA